MAQLFHYHWWTKQVEEMEEFYSQLGFRVVLRVGRLAGEMQTFNPPLTWDQFRDQNIQFRIIEMRKGRVNITFGEGKENRFDHIGFLVNEKEYEQIISRAMDLKWKVSEGERRTFVTTPWKFRVELQTRKGFIDDSDFSIQKMELSLPFEKGNLANLGKLLNVKFTNNIILGSNWEVDFTDYSPVSLHAIHFATESDINLIDPVGTKLISII